MDQLTIKAYFLCIFFWFLKRSIICLTKSTVIVSSSILGPSYVGSTARNKVNIVPIASHSPSLPLTHVINVNGLGYTGRTIIMLTINLSQILAGYQLNSKHYLDSLFKFDASNDLCTFFHFRLGVLVIGSAFRDLLLRRSFDCPPLVFVHTTCHFEIFKGLFKLAERHIRRSASIIGLCKVWIDLERSFCIALCVCVSVSFAGITSSNDEGQTLRNSITVGFELQMTKCAIGIIRSDFWVKINGFGVFLNGFGKPFFFLTRHESFWIRHRNLADCEQTCK